MRPILSTLYSLLSKNTPLVVFISLWAWAWLWWGDVLWVAHERSFFAFDAELMSGVWSRPYGTLWLMGRALLSLCVLPWLGGMLLAAIMTGVGCCLSYVFMRKHRRFSFVCHLPAVLWIMWLAYNSFNCYFKGEPGRIFGIPVLALIVAMVQAVFVCTFRRKRTSPQAQPGGDSVKWQTILPVLVVPVLVCLAVLWEKQYRPHLRPTARLERLYAAEDWTAMRQFATDNADLSCRPMAAYYAIALVRQEAVMKHLFDIRFEYDELHMLDLTGDTINSTVYYIGECDMHAGLLQFAYHKAMEDMTVDGPTIHNLKILAQVAAMRRECGVADKYLRVLGRTLGTSDFTQKWSLYVADSTKMEADPTVASIRRLEPIHDAFESSYTEPAFLGYNLALYEGRSTQALLNSVAVCLYTKLMPPFLERAQYLGYDAIMANPIVTDALAMQAIKEPAILQALPQIEMNVNRYRAYVQQMKNVGAVGNTEQRKPYAGQMWQSGKSYYPYYYYFGNLKATRKDAAKKYGYGADGVN